MRHPFRSGQKSGPPSRTEDSMNAFTRSLSTAIVFTISTFALAQAPIVRQAPSAPPPDAQQPYPNQQRQDPGAAPPDYQQMAQQGKPAPAPLPWTSSASWVNAIALYPDPAARADPGRPTFTGTRDCRRGGLAQTAQLSCMATRPSAAILYLTIFPGIPAFSPCFPSRPCSTRRWRDPDWTGQPEQRRPRPA